MFWGEWEGRADPFPLLPQVPDGYPDFGRIKNGGEQTNGPEKKQTATRIALGFFVCLFLPPLLELHV